MTEEKKQDHADEIINSTEKIDVREDKTDNNASGLTNQQNFAENTAEELPDEIKKKLEKNKADKKPRKGKKKAKIAQKVPSGVAHIKATYNNTMVTLSDTNGNVLSWASAGLAGFKGPKKSTPYAAQIITRIAVEKAREYGLSEIYVLVKGVGTGRESAIRALNANGLIITSIKDITPIPHNGCRARKPRRV